MKIILLKFIFLYIFNMINKGMAVFSKDTVISTIQNDVWWANNWESTAILRLSLDFTPGE